MPLTVTLPLVQQATLSPGTPTTRLMRSFSLLDGSRPTKTKTSLTPLTIGFWLSLSAPAGSQPPGSRNTTTSPRFTSPKWEANLFTRTRSPVRRVFSIESDGMKKACTRKVLISSASASATNTRIGSSRIRLVDWPTRRPPSDPSPSPSSPPRRVRRPGGGGRSLPPPAASVTSTPSVSGVSSPGPAAAWEPNGSSPSDGPVGPPGLPGSTGSLTGVPLCSQLLEALGDGQPPRPAQRPDDRHSASHDLVEGNSTAAGVAEVGT